MNYIIIHKNEWDRINMVKNTTKLKEREKNMESLNRHQECIENCSDIGQGSINNLGKQKQIKDTKDIQTLGDCNSRKKLDNKDVIEKAKELIFQDSCYGRQLLSALYESKALEEREAQIQFKNYIEEKCKVQKAIEPRATSLQIGNNTAFEEDQRKLYKKQINVEISRLNKVLWEKKYIENKEKRDKEKQEEIESERSVKEMLKNEIKLQAEILNRDKEAVKKYEKQNDKLKKSRAENAEREERIREVWRKYDDKIKRKEKTMFDKIHKESYKTTQSQNVYKIIERLNHEKDKTYNDFIEKGITKYKKRLNEKDQQEFESKTIDRNKRKLLDKDNELLIELKQRIDLNIDSNCRTHRHHVQEISVNKEETYKAAKRSIKPTFVAPHNKLLENLKKRENDSSWNGISGSHAQFAEHASAILRQCRYKNMARKVINDYRRINCIDEKNLPISD